MGLLLEYRVLKTNTALEASLGAGVVSDVVTSETGSVASVETPGTCDSVVSALKTQLGVVGSPVASVVA